MQQTGTKYWTKTVTAGIILIEDTDNVTEVSIVVTTAPVLVSGNFTFRGQAASPLILGTVGQTLTVSGTAGTAPIGYLQIDGSGGAFDIIMKT